MSELTEESQKILDSLLKAWPECSREAIRIAYDLGVIDGKLAQLRESLSRGGT
jgi:hypothetical protein